MWMPPDTRRIMGIHNAAKRQIMGKPRNRAAVIWANFGLYHFARAHAMSSACDLLAIELASHQRMYGWQISRALPGAQMTTLTAGAFEDQSKIKMSFRLWRVLQRFQPAYVLVPGYADLPALTAALWSRLNRRRAIMMSESNAEDYPRHRFSETVKRALVRTVFDAALVGGCRSGKYAASLGIPTKRIYYGYDVVDNDWFHQQVTRVRAQAENSLRSRDYFLFVGRLAREKNIFGLLEGFRHYVRGGGHWDLVIVGTGPQGDRLVSTIKEQGLDGRVRCVGFKNGEELIPYYAFAGTFVLPSTREPWGLVVNEAMACGLPVICSVRCGCYDDLIIEGKTGFGIEPDSPSQLALVMEQISTMDPSERAEIGLRARARVDQYSPHKLSLQLSRMMEDIGSAHPL